MKKRIGCLVLALTLLLTLAACGSGGTSQSAASTQVASTQAATSKAGPPAELNLVFPQGSASIPDLNAVVGEINKLSKEKINATVKVTGIPIANYNQQVRLMLTSQEKMDLLITGTLPFTDFSGQIANSQLLALNDQLDKNGQGIKSSVGDFLNAAKVKGQVYAVPSLRDEAKAAGFAI